MRFHAAFFTAWLCLLALAHAKDAPAPFYPSWRYDSGDQHTTLLKMDEYGTPIPLEEEPKDPEQRRISQALYADPMIEGLYYTAPNGTKVPMTAMLDQPVASFELDVDKAKASMVQQQPVICGADRIPMGRLLYCLKRMQEKIKHQKADVAEMLADPKTKPELRKLLEQKQKDSVLLGNYVGASLQTLFKAAKIPEAGMNAIGKADESGRIILPPWKSVPNSGGSPLHKGGKKGAPLSSDFLRCWWKSGAKPEDRNLLQAEDVECRNKGTNLEAFTPEMKYFFLHVKAETFAQEYVETLRMEGMARAMAANWQYTGKDLEPSGCGPFDKAIKRYKTSNKPPVATADPKYREAIKTGAKRIQYGVQAAKKLKSFIGRCLQRSEKQCIKTAAQYEAEKELESLKKALLVESAKYPQIMANHETRGEFYEDDKFTGFVDRFAKAGITDAELDTTLADASVAVTADLKRTVEKFCKGDNTDWEDLVMMPELTAAVTTQFPEFKAVQDCAELEYKLKHGQDGLGTALGMGACLIGSIGPQVVVVGPVCTAVFLGKAIYDYGEAKDKLQFTKSCLATRTLDDAAKATTVCNAADFEKAATAYDSAVTDLWLNGAFAGLEVGGALVAGVRMLRAAQLTAKELQLAKAGLTTARTLEEAEAAARLAKGTTAGTEVVVSAALRTARTEATAAIEAAAENFGKLKISFNTKGLTAAAEHLTPAELKQLTTRLEGLKSVADPALAKAGLKTLEEDALAVAHSRGMPKPKVVASGASYNLENIPKDMQKKIQGRLEELERAGVPRDKILEVFPCLK